MSVLLQTFAKDHEVQAEDEQIFLNKQLGLLNQSANQQSAIGIPRQDSVMRSLTGVSKSGDRRVSLTSQGQGSPTKKVSSVLNINDVSLSMWDYILFHLLELLTLLQIDPVKSANSSTPGEGVLANFFNSLLHKKSNQSPILSKTPGKYICVISL